MAIYSSTPPINDDPEPWLDSRGFRFRIKHSDRYGTTEWSPRPEFSRPRAHRANPVLVDFRRIFGLGDVPLDRMAGEWLASSRSWILTYNPYHINHACRVLTRLANEESK